MWHSALTTFLFLSQVLGGVISDGGPRVRSEMAEDIMRRYADEVTEPIEKRQTMPVQSLTEWDAVTRNSCQLSLEALHGVATNPSGFAVCYNLPVLDNTTGVFQADLRLYKISEPTGDFVSISSANVQVGLSYIGATVSAVNMSTLAIGEVESRSAKTASSITWPRKRQNAPSKPTLIQSYAFVGQVNTDILSSNKGAAGLQEVLVPTVSLTGTDPTGKVVNTTLSSQEATFVSGVFATPITPTKSEIEPPIQTLVVAPGAPFIVPGLTILIFPIGGVITGIWSIALIVTIAYGTYGRMQFREDYRRKAARATKASVERI